jgi:hypothetical protein
VRCGCACACGCQTKHAKLNCDAPHARWLVRLALCSGRMVPCGKHIRPVVRPLARGCGPMLASLSQSRRPTWSDCGACRGVFVSVDRPPRFQQAEQPPAPRPCHRYDWGLGTARFCHNLGALQCPSHPPARGIPAARGPRFGPTLQVARGTGQSGTEAFVVCPLTGQEWPSGAACRMLPTNGQGMGKVRLLLATSRIMLVLPRGTGVAAGVQSKYRKVS